jgi:hypothetical protein
MAGTEGPDWRRAHTASPQRTLCSRRNVYRYTTARTLRGGTAKIFEDEERVVTFSVHGGAPRAVHCCAHLPPLVSLKPLKPENRSSRPTYTSEMLKVI